uniref:Uncharacterized protein n=1 Tax=Sphaerodactylus townsendi TaxID=933632 RepID=A0ACB8G7B5_9SAUR
MALASTVPQSSDLLLFLIHLFFFSASTDVNTYPQLLAFVHAVEEINRSPHLLPNISLGFHIYDSVFSDETALGGIWGLLSGTRKVVPNYHCGEGNKLIAVIEGPTASFSLGVATVLGHYRYPQLSYGLLDPARRSKVLFPALYGMVPSESSLLSGVARLIRHFDWRWVGLITSDDDRGERAVETLAREIAKGGGCLAFTWMFKNSDNRRHLLVSFQKSSANVTVLHGTTGLITDFRKLLFWSRIKLKGQLLHFLTNMNFTNPAGEDLFFDGNGDLAAGYDVLNLISSPKKILSRVPVGSFHPQATLGHELIINKSAIQWASGFKQCAAKNAFLDIERKSATGSQPAALTVCPARLERFPTKVVLVQSAPRQKLTMLSGWLPIVLLFPEAVGVPRWSICTLSGYHHQGYYKEGDRIIGGFIPLTRPPRIQHHNFRNTPYLSSRHQSIDINTYPNLLVFVHAMEEINRSPHLLPNISLGFHIYDSVFSDETALGGIWGLLSGTRKVVPNYHCKGGNKLIAVVEGPTASLSLGVAAVLGRYRYPQLSYGIPDSALHSKVLFPALYGMVPSESSLLSGVARLIRHFNWRWVGLIASDDDQGEGAVLTLAREIGKGGSCLAFTWIFKKSYSYSEKRRELLEIFQKSSANVTVLHGTIHLIRWFKLLLLLSRIRLKGQVWILTFYDDYPSPAQYSTLEVFHGSLVLVGHQREIPGFQDFLQRFKPWHYPGDFIKILSFGKVWR